jgi:hypothetical protein
LFTVETPFFDHGSLVIDSNGQKVLKVSSKSHSLSFNVGNIEENIEKIPIDENVEYIIDMDNNNELIEKRTGLTIFYFILFF